MINRIRGQRGTSTLELIVVLPTLLFVLFSIVELSRAWLTVSLVSSAAWEAARIGTVSPANQFPNPPAAVQRVNDILGQGASVNVTCSAPCQPDAEVRADVNVTFDTVVPLLLPMLQSLTIQQTARMRYE